MSDSLILGVDPGAKWCGLALMRGRDLVDWRLLTRADGQNLRVWVEECHRAAQQLQYTEATKALGSLTGRVQLTVTIEAVEKPKSHINGKLRLNSPEYLIGTAAVMGGLIVWAAMEGFPCVLVPPEGNGSHGRQAYPVELWGPREGPAGTGVLNHVRSAVDVALAGATLMRWQPAVSK